MNFGNENSLKGQKIREINAGHLYQPTRDSTKVLNKGFFMFGIELQFIHLYFLSVGPQDIPYQD